MYNTMCRRLSRAAAWHGAILALLAGIGCGGSPPSESEAAEEYQQEAVAELEDGVYPCYTMNVTRGNGPYSLECDKAGASLTIYFNNGGHIDLDLDSEERDHSGVWTLSGLHVDRGDLWEIEIDQ